MARTTVKNRAVFLDRDGTIIHERNYLSKIRDLKFFANSVRAMKLLSKAGFKLVVVTNQSGIGRGYLTENKLKQIHKYMLKALVKKGVKIDAVYYCPHHPQKACSCRKPKTGMVKKAAKQLNIDLKKSYTVGDHTNDFLLGQNMGGTGVFVLTGHGKEEQQKIKASKGVLCPDRVEKNVLTAAKWIIKNENKN